MNFTVITDTDEAYHIKPYEVRVKIDVNNEKMLNVLNSISELPDQERLVLVFREKKLLFYTQYDFNVEKLSKTVLHPARKLWTGYTEISTLIHNEFKINVDTEKQAKKIELSVEKALIHFLKKIERKYNFK